MIIHVGLLLLSVTGICAQENPLRGVPPDLIAKYTPDDQNSLFTCIVSGEKIPFSRVNDGFVDCKDGSDEVGTSAGTSGFYCKNEGYFPKRISNSFVDDGICDCCDGSDEAEGLCPNTCAQLKEVYNKKAEDMNAKIDAGLKIKSKMIIESKLAKEQLIDEVNDLNKELQMKRDRIEQLKVKKNELAASQKNGEIYRKLNDKINQLQSSIENQLNQIQIFKDSTTQLEDILAEMNEKYNHNFNDPAVKAAAQGYLNYKSNKQNVDAIPDAVRKIEDLRSEIDNLPLQDTSNRSSFWNYSEETLKALVYSVFGISSPTVFGDIDDLSLSEIERQSDKLNKEIRFQSRSLKTLESSLDKNYGPDDILRSLSDTIVNNNIGNYKYTIQLNGDLVQIDSRNARILIGKFSEVIYDDDDNIHYKLKFGNGQRCWNGPVRSANIELTCSERNEIKQVSEPEKCHYLISMDSPLGCFEEDKIK